MKDGRGGREPQLHAWSAQSRRPGVQPGQQKQKEAHQARDFLRGKSTFSY